MMTLAATRALLAALVLAGGAFQLTGGTAPSGPETSAATRRLFEQAGYRVEATRALWLGGQIKGTETLVARHPACAAPVAITPVPIVGTRPDDAGGARAFAYGRLQGRLPSRAAVLAEAARLEAAAMLSFGARHLPPREILALDDPSACLAIASPELRSIWEG